MTALVDKSYIEELMAAPYGKARERMIADGHLKAQKPLRQWRVVVFAENVAGYRQYLMDGRMTKIEAKSAAESLHLLEIPSSRKEGIFSIAEREGGRP